MTDERRFDGGDESRVQALMRRVWNLEQDLALAREGEDEALARVRELKAYIDTQPHPDEVERPLAALRDIHDEISNGVTANWEYIDKRFAEGLGRS